ncbi:hypothetical protein STPH2_4184 [Streptomyces sp. KO7888]|nr:hypothetical protein [Streptomyces sp. KO7888]
MTLDFFDYTVGYIEINARIKRCTENYRVVSTRRVIDQCFGN